MVEICSSTYKLGSTYIIIDMPQDMPKPENISKFQVLECDCQENEKIHYTREYTDAVWDIEKKLRSQQKGTFEVTRESLHIFYTESGECRLLSFPGAPFPYAVSFQEAENRFHIWIDRQVDHMLSLDTIFISLFSLERQMIKGGAMILHSAYMCYEDTAVLFSAPSETGKSTQAGLWEKYRGTRTINGDRSLLMKKDDRWYAYGWPVCGSSEICNNEAYPICAIVMLKQAEENKAYRLKGIQAVRELLEQITINTWDSSFQIKVMDNLEELLQEVPVYRLECDISKQAVECLEQMLVVRQE